MNPLQNTAFESANGGAAAITTDITTLLFGGALLISTILWVAWVSISAYKQVASHNKSFMDMAWPIGRALFILFLMMYIVAT